MKMLKSLTVILAMCGGAVHAGEYIVDSYSGTEPIQNLVHYLRGDVTEAFTQAFPSPKYQVVVFYNHAQINQDNICSASAGITLSPKSGARSTVPLNRYLVTKLDRDGGRLDDKAVQNCQLTAIREAVKDLMAAPISELKAKL